MVNSSDFIERLEHLLEYYQISASNFADKIGVQRSSISHLLSARNKPSLEFVLKVVKNFPEVNLYWLLNGKGTFPSDNPNIDNTNSAVSNGGTSDLNSRNETGPNDTKTEAPTLSHARTQNPLDASMENSDNIQDVTALSLGDASSSGKGIDRIVIFYSDGSFKAYSEK